MPIAVFSFVAFILLAISAPIFIAILVPTIVSFELFGPPLPSTVLVQKMMQGINKFSLLAIPLFIFSADIIARGQIGNRLLKLVESMIGHITGGLAITTAIACALFGAISGIGAAAVVSIGPIVYPALIRQGYSRGFTVGLILTSSTLAMLIPPGVAMILYSLQTMSSVSAVFLAGLSAGVIFTALLSVYSYVYARVLGIGRLKKTSWNERLTSLKQSGWALGLPAIIFGGIYSGLFTPTEAAAGACAYAMFVETIVYRQLRFRDLFKVSAESSMVIAMLLILITAGSAMTYFLTVENVPDAISGMLDGNSAVTVLLLINILFLLAGMIVDPNSAIIVLTPLIYPVASALNIDAIHLSAVIVLNVAVGMISPPFGLNIFIGITTFKVPYWEVVKSVLPFILVSLVALALVTYIPELVLWLPRIVSG
jgi:C4-dicarboxylate transporter DctM subunit